MRVNPGWLLLLVGLTANLVSCGDTANDTFQVQVSDTLQRISNQKGVDYGRMYAVVTINEMTQTIEIAEDAPQSVPVSGITLDAQNEFRIEWWETFQGSPLVLAHQAGSMFIASTDASTVIEFPYVSAPYDDDLDGKTNLLERQDGSCPVAQPCAIAEPTMVSIPAGSFLMGAVEAGAPANEYPQHPVTVQAFSLAAAEITWAEWAVCVDAGGCTVVIRPEWVADLENPGAHPVGGVTWGQIQAYIEWINGGLNGGYRLATEAEFEYALRGGTTTRYFYGDDNSNFCVYVNGYNFATTCEDGYLYTSPVKSLQPNPFGLYDMNGNVGEWTSDCWHSDYTGAPSNGESWQEGAGGNCNEGVLRGGNYVFDNVDFRGSTRRQKTRHSDYPEVQEGFRLARD